MYLVRCGCWSEDWGPYSGAGGSRGLPEGGHAQGTSPWATLEKGVHLRPPLCLLSGAEPAGAPSWQEAQNTGPMPAPCPQQDMS